MIALVKRMDVIYVGCKMNCEQCHGSGIVDGRQCAKGFMSVPALVWVDIRKVDGKMEVREIHGEEAMLN